MIEYLVTSFNFFCLLTPFFVLSLFLQICGDQDKQYQNKIATKTAGYILFICLLILFCGPALFKILGITLIAFQIGSGLILLLSGINMMQDQKLKLRPVLTSQDPSLIPLTLPITVGPGTIGALFVAGVDIKCVTILGVCTAVFCIWCLLYFSKIIYKLLGDNGLNILSKLTGLFLSVLAVQSILNGIVSFINELK